MHWLSLTALPLPGSLASELRPPRGLPALTGQHPSEAPSHGTLSQLRLLPALLAVHPTRGCDSHCPLRLWTVSTQLP